MRTGVQQTKPRQSSWLSRTLLFIPCSVLLVLILRGLLVFPIAWDFLAYHLPFSLMHYGLTTYQPPDYLVEIYRAFPPLPHLIQGLFIKLTGNFNAATLLNSLSLVAMIFCLKKLNPGLRVSLFIWLVLAIPLVIVHMSSGYVDLFVGVLLTILFAATNAIMKGDLNIKSLSMFVFALVAAMLSKYQAWPFCFICSFFLFIKHISELKGKSGIYKAKFFSAFAFVSLILAFWPIKNFILFNNPTYPVMPPGLSAFYEFSGTSLEKGARLQQIPQRLWEVSNGRLFLESILETSRLYAGGFKYSVDQGGYDGGPVSPHFRIGGWSPFFMLLSISWLVSGFQRTKAAIWSSAPISVSLVFLFFVPQSHELRYWLFVPMILAYFCASYPETRTARARVVFYTMLGLCVFWSIYQTREQFIIKPSFAEDHAPPGTWNNSPVLGNKDSSCVFGKLPFTIYWAGPQFRTSRVKDCTKY